MSFDKLTRHCPPSISSSLLRRPTNGNTALHADAPAALSSGHAHHSATTNQMRPTSARSDVRRAELARVISLGGRSEDDVVGASKGMLPACGRRRVRCRLHRSRSRLRARQSHGWVRRQLATHTGTHVRYVMIRVALTDCHAGKTCLNVVLKISVNRSLRNVR